MNFKQARFGLITVGVCMAVCANAQTNGTQATNAAGNVQTSKKMHAKTTHRAKKSNSKSHATQDSQASLHAIESSQSAPASTVQSSRFSNAMHGVQLRPVGGR